MNDATPKKQSSHRDLFRGSADLLVLSILADGPRWGYSIQRRLEQVTGETLSAGSLYPLLHRLEADGLIRADWDQTKARPRKHYHLTPAGEKKLRADAAEWQAYLGRLQSLIIPALRQITNHPAASG